MNVGYARVSTADQNLELQEEALTKIGCEKIFRDTASGSDDARQGLIEALAYVRSGDTLVVWKLDRLGRSLKHLIEIVNLLNGRGVELLSLYRKRLTLRPQAANSFFMFSAPWLSLNVS